MEEKRNLSEDSTYTERTGMFEAIGNRVLRGSSALRRRLALYLAVLMMLPTLFAAFPMRAEAASMYADYDALTIEVGQKYYAGDLIYYYGVQGKYTLSQLSSATYKSSKTSVAKVNKSTGLVSAKSVGTTKITAVYKSKKVVIELQVVEAGTLGTTTTFKNQNQLAKKMYKAFSSDPVAAVELAFQFITVTSHGVFYELRDHGLGYDSDTNRYNLYIPLGARYETLYSLYNPLATYSAKAFHVAEDSSNYFSASVAKNTLTIKLENKVNEAQVAWLRNTYTQSSTKNTCFSVYIWDETSSTEYVGMVYVTAGSKKLTVRLYDNNRERQAVQEGHKYHIYCDLMEGTAVAV